MDRNPNSRPYFGRIESLRGLGSLAIIAHHVGKWPIHGVPLLPDLVHSGWLGSLFPRQDAELTGGHAALMLFFVISGFVLRIALEFGSQTVRRSAFEFFVKRIFRIYPIVILGTLLAVFATGGVIQSYEQPPRAITFLGFLRNVALIDIDLNTTLWALQVELLAAPVIFLMYFAEKRWGPNVPLAIAIGTTPLIFGKVDLLFRPFAVNFFAIALGIAIPTSGRRIINGLSTRQVRAVFPIAFAAWYLAGPFLGFFSRFTTLIEGYSAAVLVSIIAYRFDLSTLKLLDARPLRNLGRISGSSYVLHMTLMLMLVAYLSRFIPAEWVQARPMVGGPVVFVLTLMIFLGCAAMTYHLIERPGIAVGSRLTRRPVEPPAGFRYDAPHSIPKPRYETAKNLTRRGS